MARDRDRLLWPFGWRKVTLTLWAPLQGSGDQWGLGVMLQLFPLSLWGAVTPARACTLSGRHGWRRGRQHGLGSPGTGAHLGQALGLFLGWKGEGDPVGLIA